MDALVIDDVFKSFGDVRAVDGLNARVAVGQVYGFLGPNGAGKTTTIRMVMDIIRPDRGRIEVLGRSSAHGTRERVGYMPEERGLYRKMTVGKVLAYFGALKGLAGTVLARQVDRWLEQVELSSWAGRKVEDLSRGMHQKLQFAATCINEPDLLILDEPFSGLDPVNLELLRNVLLQMRDGGKTIIFSTHVMHEAENLCDAILLINKGRVVIDGTLDQLRASWRTNTVVAELEGDTSFLGQLPHVQSVTPRGRRLEIALAAGGDPQELLRAVVERNRVLTFEIKVPSLHEVFVHLVGSDDAPHS